MLAPFTKQCHGIRAPGPSFRPLVVHPHEDPSWWNALRAMQCVEIFSALTPIPSRRYSCLIMERHKATAQTIEIILTAAERVVLRDGVMRLTVEAVAREAKLSKGGILYHFATKESLIQAMLDRLIQYYEQEIAQQQENDTVPGHWTRAYVRTTLAPLSSYPEEADFPKSKEVGAGLIVAAATNPKLLEPLRKRFRTWQRAIERDGISPTRATVIRLAVDGLWLADVLGIWSLSGKLRRQVLNELIRLTRDTGQTEGSPEGSPRAGSRAGALTRRRRRDGHA